MRPIPSSRRTGDADLAGTSAVEDAIGAFRRGDPVLVHDADDREGETDLLVPAADVTPERTATLRNDGGGLIFVALPDEVAAAFDLPYLHEVLDHPAADFEDVGYDARPSFSLTVNHRDTFTGITDDDRSHTIRELAAAADAPAGTDFAAEFRAPGHVHLLRAAPGLLGERLGHTELGVALALAADREPAVAGCEMLDDATGGALPTTAAREYAARHGIPFVEGAELVAELG
jgi:3,4-dihydroxy 2-butanone 4-phosphate synthase